MVGNPPKQRLRIGFVARCYINKGEELFFNYGIYDNDLPWTATDAKKVATTLCKATKSQLVCYLLCATFKVNNNKPTYLDPTKYL